MAQQNAPSNLVTRLAYLERELRKLKQFTERQSMGRDVKDSRSLRGLLKGIKIEPDEIEEAKTSLFRTTY
jgi:hypothetical protein